ncbi:hypothetical protein P167DRAFT_155707 [Morchella conica CCBAS932]|uniref:Nephrocystin 3-like N-terminal domain-containing protein n=1 Tax=Morchella conica CCBAS932 TaxID=1392247 RepID=A0A3N4K7D6_9PEZI|nr:hypothetical protein P167DRAFT_155707 [Morchella conica CCBAS932]
MNTVIDSANAEVVWTLFREAVDTCSQEEQDLIWTQFLGGLLQSMTDDSLLVLKSIPNLGPQDVLNASSPSRLWPALGAALSTISGYPGETGNQPGKRFKNLGIILDIGKLPKRAFQELIRNLVPFRPNVQKPFDMVRTLVVREYADNDFYLEKSVEFLILYSEYAKYRQDCLRSLAFQNTRYEKISPHQKHTFNWLWETEEYRPWNTCARADPGFLLVEGKPGSGKSTLMRYIRENINPVVKDAIISSFFYSARDGAAERSHLNMLKALLHSVLEADETFFIHFQQIYHKRTNQGHLPMDWRIDELRRIMEDVYTKHPFPSTIYCVIDALDESENTGNNRIEIIEHFKNVLKAVQNNQTGPLVKVFLGSRPINELQYKPSGGMNRISLQDYTKTDIRKYTNARLKGNVFEECGISLRKVFEDYILATADGVFLWVRLVIAELEQKVRNGSSPSNLLELLKSLPKDLESFFEHIFQEIKKGRDAHELINGGRIFGFCLLSHRAIELGELRDALALFNNKTRCDPDHTRWE